MNPRRLNRAVNGGGPPRPAGMRISGGEHETLIIRLFAAVQIPAEEFGIRSYAPQQLQP